jgi:hypothetical protein
MSNLLEATVFFLVSSPIVWMSERMWETSEQQQKRGDGVNVAELRKKKF